LGRVQGEDRGPDVPDDRVDFVDLGFDRGTGVRVAGPGCGGLQGQPVGEEALDDAVA